MPKLSSSARKKLPSKDFAGPGRSYPIEDKGHAKAALSMVSRYGSAKEKAEVRSKVKSKFGMK